MEFIMYPSNESNPIFSLLYNHTIALEASQTGSRIWMRTDRVGQGMADWIFASGYGECERDGKEGRRM
jgi:hypothetical protein